MKFKQYLINEILETPYKFKVMKSKDHYVARFKTEDGKKGMFDAAFLDEMGLWGIAFTIDGNIEITGKGDAFKIFSTIKYILLDFINKIKPDSFLFTSKEKTRNKLYDKFAKMIVNKTQYKKYKTEIGKEKEYIFKK
mgnify:CR=1 FL=1